jgi:class 3 adenylate cyclase
MLVTKTVLELDLKGYSDVARDLEEHISAEIVAQFNAQIQGFVDAGLAAVGVTRTAAVLATTGDGAILLFDSPSIAHCVAVAVHKASATHNQSKTIAAARRWFRIGIATGELAFSAENATNQCAGTAIARAVRMEAAGNIGEILIDVATFAGLTEQQQCCYGNTEIIRGKRDEQFAAHRSVVVTGLSVEVTLPTVGAVVKPSAALAIWQEKKAYLEEQQAISASAAIKFELKWQIEEAKQKIAELSNA